MAYDWVRLKEIAQLTASAASLYTNPAATKTYIKWIILHNTNAADVIVTLWVVPDSTGSIGTAADANQMFEQSIPANRTVSLEFPQPGIILLDENETLQGKADTASVVTVQVYGATE